MSNIDIDRLRAEYARRRDSEFDRRTYSLFNRSALFSLQQRQRNLTDLLSMLDIRDLRGMCALEIGCGRAGILTEYLGYGLSASALFGVDLLHDRLLQGKRLVGDFQLTCADGQCLPFGQNRFDIVFQYTAFSSILDTDIKNQMAQEMLRVVKQSGVIIWYDFWVNPKNPQTRGITKSEILRLFPSCAFRFKRVTLAPPIARRVVPVSWQLAQFLEKLTVFNSHYLVAIRRNTV